MELQALFPISQDLAIYLPDGSETGVTFKVIGTDNAAFHAKAKQQAQTRMDGEKPLTIEQQAKAETEMLATCVVGWSGLTEGGAPLQFSNEKAIDLLGDPRLSYIKDQVAAYATSRANFFRQGSTATN